LGFEVGEEAAVNERINTLALPKTKVDALLEERAALVKRLCEIDQDLLSHGYVPAHDIPSETPGKSSSRREIESAVEKVLRHAAAPLKRRDILAAIRQCGVDLRTRNPLGSLSHYLARSEVVIRLDGHGYWHRDRPYAAAGYLEDLPRGQE
jgi:hypothetical protein